MTLEPDGQATGCNPVEVGSTPTSVSCMRIRILILNFAREHMASSGQRRTGLAFGDWRRAFREWNENRGDVVGVVAHLDRATDLESVGSGFDSRPQPSA